MKIQGSLTALSDKRASEMTEEEYVNAFKPVLTLDITPESLYPLNDFKIEVINKREVTN